MKHIILILSIGLLLITSCSPSKTLVDTSCSGYKSPEFSRELISLNKMALMPILGGNDKEQYRRPIGDQILIDLNNTFEEINITSPKEVIWKLNKSNLVNNYYTIIDNYEKTGIITGSNIKQIGDSLGVQYLLFVKLLTSTEYNTIYTGTYSNTTLKLNEVYVQSQIWDVSLGDIVWEGKGGTCCMYCEDIIERTSLGLVNTLGLPKGYGSCEQPAQIATSVQKAYSKSIIGIAIATLALTLLLIL